MWADANRADAFEELYRRCYPELVDLCRRLLCGRGDPEAIAQEAFVRAWRSLDKFTGARPFWPWVATIARRLCIDHRRRLTRETMKSHVEASLFEARAVTPDELAEADEEHRAALAALKRLKPSEQRVITMRDLNGWSYDEIARFEGVTVESIRGSLKRARVALRQSYAKLAAGAPAALGAGSWRRFRARLDRVVSRVPSSPFQAGLPLGMAGDAALWTMAAVIGVGAVGMPVAPTVGLDPISVAMAAADGPGGSSTTGASAATSSTGTGGSSARRAAPYEGAGGGAPFLPVPGLPSDGGNSPDDVTFTEIAASPSYESDSTVFAVGTVTRGCPYVVCPTLFRSRDGGATWHRTAAANFSGGHLLFAESFARDGRLFAAGPTGLLESRDSGGSFSSLAPIGGSAAISPQFAAGDPRILFGAAPGWEYRDDLGTMKPGGMVLPSTATAGTVEFVPNYARERVVVVGGSTVDSAGRNVTAVFKCEDALCRTAGVFSPVVGPAQVAVSPAYERDRTTVAWRGGFLWVSQDGGDSYSPRPLPIAGDVRSVAMGPDGVLHVAVRGGADGATTGGVLASTDAGRTWRHVGRGTVLDRGAESVVALPDGRLLAGPTATGGLLCSLDGGTQWERTCGN